CEVVVTGFDPSCLFVRRFVLSQDEPATAHVQLDDLIRAEKQRRETLRGRLEEEQRQREEGRRRKEEEQSKARDSYPRWRWVMTSLPSSSVARVSNVTSRETSTPLSSTRSSRKRNLSSGSRLRRAFRLRRSSLPCRSPKGIGPMSLGVIGAVLLS